MFVVNAAGKTKGPFGDYYILSTDQGLYNSDARSKQIIPKFGLQPVFVNGREIYCRSKKKILVYFASRKLAKKQSRK